MKIKKIMLDDSAFLEAYVADEIEKYTRKAILVIPGGGYEYISAEREGEAVALAFIPHGFNAFVLHYSVAREKIFPAQLIQASIAMKHIKDNAEEYGIDNEQVFAVGFSAGGHLCASLGTLWNKKEIYDEMDMPYGYNKPKGVMLIYPVVSGVSEYAHKGSFRNLFGTDEPAYEQLKEASIEFYVTKQSCPAYIVHAVNDTCVPLENSLILAEAYRKCKVPYEMHIYPRGEHGFSLANEITCCGNMEFVQKENAKWVENAVEWAVQLKEYDDRY